MNFSVVGISEISLGLPAENMEDARDTAIALAELLGTDSACPYGRVGLGPDEPEVDAVRKSFSCDALSEIVDIDSGGILRRGDGEPARTLPDIEPVLVNRVFSTFPPRR